MPLSGFTAPNTPPGTPPTTTNTGGGSLDGFNAPTPESQKIYGLNQQQQGYDQTAQNTGSDMGILKNTIEDTPEATTQESTGLMTGWWDSIKQFPSLLKQDMVEAGKNFKNSSQDPNPITGVGAAIAGTAKLSVLPALQAVSALTEPLGQAIGQAIKATGLGNLVDKTGTVIADKTGITNAPAFQKFMAQHPRTPEYLQDLIPIVIGMFDGTDAAKPVNMDEVVNKVDGLSKALVNNAVPESTKALGDSPEETKAPTKVPVNSTLEFNRGTGANPMLKSAFEANFNSEPTLGQTLNQAGTTAQPLDGFDTSGVRVQAPTVPTEPTIPQDATPGQMQTAKLSSDIANQIGQQFGDLPQYKTMNMADQASQALKLMEDDPIGAKAVAMGEKSAPGDLREGSVFTAVKAKALADGDTQTLIDLSHSKLATEASELGQRIKAYDSGANAGEDPVKILSDIQKTREDTFQKVNKKSSADVKAKDVNDIDQEVKKNTPKKADWKDFISSLQCK